MKRAQKQQLQAVEKRLRADPGSLDLHLQRAILLTELGRLAEAVKEYIKVLERNPNDPTALNNVGCVLVAMGKLSAARTVYQEAVRRHPHSATCRVNLGNVLFEESERLAAYQRSGEVLQLRQEALEHYELALRIAPNCEKAHEGLSYALQALGERAKAEWHRRKAFENRYIIQSPYRGENAAVRVLQLVSTTGGNVRLQEFLDDRIFQRFRVLPEFYKSETPLPAHQLVINAIGDAEVSSGALAAAQKVLGLTDAPVINSPRAVLATTRSNNAKRFAGLPGVVTPTTCTLSREELSGANAAAKLADHGLEFPLLLRTAGFHTGLNFVRVDNPNALPSAAADLPGEELLVIQYLDARGSDGKSRKYRAMMIGGRIYPLHLAISDHWKIHYFTAEMADNAKHREEDAAFLKDMPGVLGPVAMNALERIQSLLGLDYAGIDFGLNAEGELLLFEANATMVVLPPDSDARWDYRRPAYKRIFAAVQGMFLQRAAATVPGRAA